MKKISRIYIEITDACNLACSFCPQVEGKARMMDSQLFYKIIDEAKSFTNEAALHILGEPLLNPDLLEFIDYTIAAGMRIKLVTNGTLLKGKLAAELAVKKIHQINLSLHTEQKNRDVEAYLTEIFDFIKLTHSHNPQTYFNLRLWNILSKDNREMYDRINRHFATDYTQPQNLTEFKDQKGLKLTERVYLHLDTCFTWPKLTLPDLGGKGTCFALDTQYGVLSDGRIVPCCLDADGVLSLGNVKDVSLQTALASERAVKMHKGFKHGVLVEDLCRRCDFIRRFGEKI